MDLALLLRIFFREARGQPNVEIAVLEVFMKKSSGKKRTQKRIDLEKIMQDHLGKFQDWLYIGKPELMRQYFSDLLPSDYFNKLSRMERQKHTWAQNPSLKMKDSKENVGENEPSQVANKNVEDNYYFQTGLDEKFENSEVAKKYGEKLRELRKNAIIRLRMFLIILAYPFKTSSLSKQGNVSALIETDCCFSAVFTKCRQKICLDFLNSSGRGNAVLIKRIILNGRKKA